MSSLGLEPRLPPAAPLVAHLVDVPPGEIMDGLPPPEWRDRFCVLEDASTETVHVLSVPDALGSLAMFDLRRRLAEKGYATPVFLRATPEIVKLVRDRRSDGDHSARLASHDATDIERFAHGLIDAALAARASDIHIETRSEQAEVFFRIDGLRRLHCNISIDSARGLGIVLYSVHADAGSKDVLWDPQQVMDGVIEHRSPTGASIQLRFSSAPIFPTGNFHIVIRLLRMDASQVLLSDLGYTAEQLTHLETFVASLSGMVLLCGPTNSGKSTSMQALMRTLHMRHGTAVKIITVEDPVEYLVPGACQISISRRRRPGAGETGGSAFTTFLRGTLRQDPDVVMIGEIRDHDSASVAKDLVLAGRKLLTTLHTYSATWAFVRLRELGLPIELLTMPGFVSGIVYQRLVPTVCPDCSLPAFSPGGDPSPDLPPGLQDRLVTVCDPALHHVRLRGSGCPSCGGTGVGGRTLCAEFVLCHPEFLTLIARQDYHAAERHWHQHGGIPVDDLGVTALGHGISKMRQGLIDPRDLESNVGLLSSLPGMGEALA